MKALWGGSVLVALVLNAQALPAQRPDSSARMMNQGMQQMARMDSMNARLDTLVVRMNEAKGNAKITAMAQVINELVTQRRTMQAHMRQMMQSHRGMMGMGRVGIDSVAADTAGRPKPRRQP